jgi:hypothetical protein
MGVPFDPRPIIVTVPTSGKSYGVVLPINRRGTILRWRVLQLVGTTAEGFTFALYSRYEAMAAIVAASWGSVAAAKTGLALPAPPANVNYNTVNNVSYDPSWQDKYAPLYQTVPARTAASGQTGDDPAGFGLACMYATNDYQDASGSTMKSTVFGRYLYVVITPSGTVSNKQFGIDICVDEPTQL